MSDTLYSRLLQVSNELTALKTSHEYGLGTFKIWTQYRDVTGRISGFLLVRWLIYEVVEDGIEKPLVSAEASHINIEIPAPHFFSENGKNYVQIFFYLRDYFLGSIPENNRIWVHSTAKLEFIKEGKKEGFG